MFVQIGDENVHRVRALMDEVFGEDNFVVDQILFKNQAAHASVPYLDVTDYILWYCEETGARVKYRQLVLATKRLGDVGADEYSWVDSPTGRAVTTHDDKRSELILKHGCTSIVVRQSTVRRA